MTTKIKVHERIDESAVYEMATVNLDDPFKEFSYPTYKAVIKGGPREHPYNGKAHVHISHKQEGWEIRMSLDGHFLSIVHKGKRSEKDRFTDVEKAYRAWVVRQCVTFPEITNYVYVQRQWNANNPDHKITVEQEFNG